MLLQGPLLRNIKCQDCTWDLDEAPDGTEALVLTLEKAVKGEAMEKQDRWSCLIVGHPLIDINLKGTKDEG